MTVQLRAMRWWDIEPVMTIESALFADDAWTDTMFWSELAERETRHYLVADDAGDVVGYAGLCAYPPDQAYVQTIAVATSYQGRGVGAVLLRALLDVGDERACRRIDLEVRADNAVAIGLYEQNGFAPIGVRRGYYQPSGADAVVMRRDATA